MTDLITPAELVNQMVELSEALEESHNRTVKAAQDFADAEHDYSVQRAQARATVRTNHPSLLAAERDDKVDALVAVAKKRKTLADLFRQSARDKEQNIRAQMSALQTIAKTVDTEMQMGGYSGRRAS